MNQRLAAAGLLALCLAACSKTPDSPGNPFSDRAAQIARTSIIVDTHIDVPYRLSVRPDDVSQATERGDFDYPRAAAGGLNAPFMSIYTPASLELRGESKAKADRLIDGVEAIVKQAPDKFAIALSTADVREQFERGVISLPLGMENGSPIEGDLENLRHFYDRGIRYLSLAHGESNHLSDSSYDDNRPWKGLSDTGKEVIKEMNRLGIMVDVSHLSDRAFWDALEVTNTPVIASHSSARHFTPGWERNMSDEMIAALVDNGGVIQINFGSMFLTKEAYEYSKARSDSRKAWKLEHQDVSDTDLYEVYAAIYAEKQGPFPYATIDDVLDHIDHAVRIAGIEHVGIGSDFDGVGDALPVGLKDVSGYPNLIAGLLGRGYSEEDIRKILGENLLRVWEAAEDYAATTSSST